MSELKQRMDAVTMFGDDAITHLVADISGYNSLYGWLDRRRDGRDARLAVVAPLFANDMLNKVDLETPVPLHKPTYDYLETAMSGFASEVGSEYLYQLELINKRARRAGIKARFPGSDGAKIEVQQYTEQFWAPKYAREFRLAAEGLRAAAALRSSEGNLLMMNNEQGEK